MLARQHLFVNGCILVVIALLCAFLGFFDYILMHALFFFYGGALFLLGAILPDADSNDRGSYIYHRPWLKWFALLGIAWVEYPLMLITKRKRGHRESLHTILGIAVTSFVAVFIFALIGFFFLKQWFLSAHLFGFGCLFLGQFAHLIEDCQRGWRPTFL